MIRRSERAQLKSCREPRCSPRVGPVCRETFGVASRVPSTVLHFNTDLGLHLTRCRGQGPHLGMTGESRGFSQGAAGFSSYDGEFRLPLVLAQGSPIFHSSCEGELGLTPFRPLSGLQETPVVTREESGVLCFPSSRARTPRMRLECKPEITVGPGEEY